LGSEQRAAQGKYRAGHEARSATEDRRPEAAHADGALVHEAARSCAVATAGLA